MTNKQFLSDVLESLYPLSYYGGMEDTHTMFNTIAGLIKHGGCPDSYFNNFCGSGCFKEAWEIGPLCAKFAVADNMFETEMSVYHRAAEFGIQHIFCPTFFHKLPKDAFILLSEMDEVVVEPGDPRFEPERCDGQPHTAMPMADYLILQPKVFLRDDLTIIHNPYDYDKSPLYLNDGTKLSGYEYMSMQGPYEWRASIIEEYGDTGYRDISWALRRLGIEDLHTKNVGWLYDKPVIIDWVSYQKPTIPSDLC